MNSNQFSRGDILVATDRSPRAGVHFIIYYEAHPRRDFIGGMITHLDDQKNTAMSAGHFLKFDATGNPYSVTYDNSFLVIAKLMKFESWGPFTKVGQLSHQGIRFVEATIDHLPPMTFAKYYYHIHNS